MKRRYWMIAMLWTAGAVSASAEPLALGSPTKSKFQRPEDVLWAMPGLSSIPRNVPFARNLRMKLNGDELRIDYRRPISRAKRSLCNVTLSYAAPLMNSFSSQLDLPLLSVEQRGAWYPSIGDYTVRLSGQAVRHSEIRLVAKARF